MAADFVWAIDENGKPTKCKAKPENRGKRNCNHKFHGEVGQSFEDFAKSNNIKLAVSSLEEEVGAEIVPQDSRGVDYISQEEIDEFARRLDEIAGERVTEENFQDILMKLTPEQIDKINKIGFEAAPAFSLPVSDEMYDEVNDSNKIYFAELPDYHIGGKAKAITDMFGSIGPVPVQGGGESDIKSNYREGLSAREYFEKQHSARGSQIQKTVSISAPGEAARTVFYGMADTEVIDDCGNHDSHGILECKAPGVCKKCAKKSGWDIEEGQLVGSIISTQVTEGLTQASLNAIHTSGKNESKAEWEIIKDTLFGYATSPIIIKASEAKTTMEARQIIYDGLKEHYDAAKIGIDKHNIEMVSKKLTSYVKDGNGGVRYVKDDELCDLPSMKTIGGHNNIFLQAELKYAYDKFTKPGVYDNSRNSVTEMMG